MIVSQKVWGQSIIKASGSHINVLKMIYTSIIFPLNCYSLIDSTVQIASHLSEWIFILYNHIISTQTGSDCNQMMNCNHLRQCIFSRHYSSNLNVTCYAEQSCAFENELNLLMRLQVKDRGTYAFKSLFLNLWPVSLFYSPSSHHHGWLWKCKEKEGDFGQQYHRVRFQSNTKKVTKMAMVLSF